MKKLLLSAAIAASAISSAQASTYQITSNVIALDLWNGFENFNPTITEAIAVSGTLTDIDDDGIVDSSDISFGGQIVFGAAGVDVEVTFDMKNGNFVPGLGTTFVGGHVFVRTDTRDGNGFTHFETSDLSVDNIFMIAGKAGHAVPSQQLTTGLIIPDISPLVGITNPTNTDVVGATLPGLWDGGFNGTNFNGALTAMTIMGFTVGVYASGDVTVAPVPVPAAAWLFGSALLGLSGLRQHRNKEKMTRYCKLKYLSLSNY